MLAALPLISCSDQKIKSKDNTLSIDERVHDLLSRMTLEEKAAQMVSIDKEVKDSIDNDEEGNINIDIVKILFTSWCRTNH